MISLIALCCALLAGAEASIADGLLEKLRKASSRSDGGLLPLHAKYEKYAFAKTRKFGLVTLFTARNPKYRCQSCILAQSSMKAAMRSIWHGMAWNRPADGRNETEVYQNSSTIFFALADNTWNADFEKSPNPFRAHGLQNVPYIAYLPPTEGDGSKSRGQFQPNYVLEPNSDQSTARILEMIAQDQEPEGSVPQLVSVSSNASIVIAFAVLVAVGAAAMAADPSSYYLVTRPAVWMTLSLLTMTISISGVIYCVIRTPPTFAVDGKGNPTIFSMQDGQGQTVLGGLAAGGLAMLAGVGAIIAIEAAKRGGARSELGVFVWVVIGLGLFVACYYRLVGLYSAKVKWWSPGGLMSPELRVASRKAVGWLEEQHIAGVENGWDVWQASPASVHPWRMAQAQLERTQAGRMIADSLASAVSAAGSLLAANSTSASE